VKRAILFCFLILPFALDAALSGQAGIDSLLGALKTAPADTNKVHLLYKISRKYRGRSSYDTSLVYLKQGQELAKTLGFSSGIAAGHLYAGNIFLQRGNYPDALDSYFTALTQYEQLGNKKDMANCLGNIGYVYTLQGNYSQAFETHMKCLEVARQMNNKSLIAKFISTWADLQRPKTIRTGPCVLRAGPGAGPRAERPVFAGGRIQQ